MFHFIIDDKLTTDSSCFSISHELIGFNCYLKYFPIQTLSNERIVVMRIGFLKIPIFCPKERYFTSLGASDACC
jgi:hypothetical protein